MSVSGLYYLKKSGLNHEKTNQALEMLLIDRKHEFRELSEVLLKIPNSIEVVPNSEYFILNFCLEVDESFKTWSGEMELSTNSPLKALTIMRQLSRNKTTMNQLTHLLNLAYTLANEFKEIYRRLI